MSLARVKLRDARDELLDAQEEAEIARLEASTTRAHIHDAYAEIEAVRRDTKTAQKALVDVWAEVGRVAEIREARRVAGLTESDALRADVDSVRNELRTLRAELANIKASNQSWSTISRHPTNSSTLFSYHYYATGDSDTQWIAI